MKQILPTLKEAKTSLLILWQPQLLWPKLITKSGYNQSALRLKILQLICSIEGEIDGNPWFYDIKWFIEYQEYPLGAFKAFMKTLRRLAMKFYLNGEILYNKSFNGTLLRCLDEIEAKVALQEIHEGICATHANRHMIARQMQRSRQFWMTMERDCINYVGKYHKCQVCNDKINAPPAPLFNMTSPWSFVM